MKIELISIGNELLSGLITNTNASFLSAELAYAGFNVSQQTVLPDERSAILKSLQEAFQRAEIVISTGGLGPTCDDITRSVAADFFQSDFCYDEIVAAALEKRYGKDFPTLKDQATRPVKAKAFVNPIGSAPGLVFEEKGRILILLPGVPREMKELFFQAVLPLLKEKDSKKVLRVSKQIYLVAVPEAALSEALVDPVLRELEGQYPQIQFGIYPGVGILTLQLTTHDQDSKQAEQLLSKPAMILKAKFAKYILDISSKHLEKEVQERFIQCGWTLSVAESCTGGRLAAKLTEWPGSSQFFVGGVVAYSNALKTTLLGISPDLLMQKGAVSAEVVQAMLSHILVQTKSDFGIAVSGIAGPSGGTKEKPVGTIWAAVGYKASPPFVWQFRAPGNREVVMEYATNVLLAQLLRYAEKVQKKR